MRRQEGASGAGRGWGVASASALGRGPVGGAVGLEFPSKGIRREFWNSLRTEFEGTLVACWKYYASCRAHPATIT